MRYKLILFIIVAILQACSPKSELTSSGSDEQALVTVNGKTLYKQELDDFIAKDINPADSAITAEAYIKMWIKSELMYEKAKDNLTDEKKIDELVNNYKQSLTIFTYQEQLLKERLSNEITEKDLNDYYESNPNQFDLENNIIKGLFLKVPLTSSKLEDLRKWYQSTSEKSIENIEKYSLENAVIYDYFYDKWIDFEDVMINIPYIIENSSKFLKENKRLEIQDSTYIYLLNIKEYMLIPEKAPFEYAKGQILDIVVNQKRENFIKKFENDLYDDAINSNRIHFHNK